MSNSKSAQPGGGPGIGSDDGDGVSRHPIECPARTAVGCTEGGRRSNRGRIVHCTGFPVIDATDVTVEAGTRDRSFFDRHRDAYFTGAFISPVEGRTTLDIFRAPGCAANWVNP